MSCRYKNHIFRCYSAPNLLHNIASAVFRPTPAQFLANLTSPSFCHQFTRSFRYRIHDLYCSLTPRFNFCFNNFNSNKCPFTKTTHFLRRPNLPKWQFQVEIVRVSPSLHAPKASMLCLTTQLSHRKRPLTIQLYDCHFGKKKYQRTYLNSNAIFLFKLVCMWFKTIKTICLKETIRSC